MINEETIQKIAGLVKINLTEGEKSRLALDIGEMACFADNLAKLDTEGVAPTTHAAQMRTVYREDAVVPPMPRDKALANAPDRDEACFLTPKVLD